jgi:hypothetical protein
MKIIKRIELLEANEKKGSIKTLSDWYDQINNQSADDLFYPAIIEQEQSQNKNLK